MCGVVVLLPKEVPVLGCLLLLVLLEFALHLLTINTLFIYVFGHLTYKFFVFIHVSLVVLFK